MYNLNELLRDESTRNRLARQVASDESATLLRSIKLKIISNCNLKCEMCRYWRIAKQQLELNTICDVLDGAASLGCQKVHFSGGEVTLHADLEEAIRRAADLGMRVNLTSNGIVMDKRRARRWIESGLRSASFSLDGVESRTHDKIRGVDGAWKRTVRSVRILQREIVRRRAKLRIRINTVLSRQNLRQLPGLIELAGRLGAVDVLPMPIDGKTVPRPREREIALFNRDIVPECARLRTEFGMPVDAGRLYPFGRTEEEIRMAAEGRYAFGHYDRHPCYAPWLHAFISHTGDVFACCMTRERMPSLGNVREQPLTEIFQGTAYQSFRRSMRQERLAVCSNCDQYLRENRLVQSRLEQQGTPLLALPVLEAVR